MITVMSYEDTPERKNQDIIDLLTESAQKITHKVNEDGTISQTLINDPETIYWKTQIVNSPTFARFVLELKNFERLSRQTVNNMSGDRARVLSAQISEIVSSFRYSVDAKSSESLRNERNTQSTLIDKLNRVKIEKSFSTKEDLKKGIFASLIGKKESQDAS